MLIFPVGLLAAPVAAGINFDGQVSLAGALSHSRANWQSQSTLRYLPGLLFESAITEQLRAGAELAACCQAQLDWLIADSVRCCATAKAYRAALWAAGDRFELRAGLQKLNFGSATLLRPLQWFDRLDPSDPLGFTDGVCGLLFRVWPCGNTGLWAWGLLDTSRSGTGNVLAPADRRPRFGGRAELPLPLGEAALTFHHLPQCSINHHRLAIATPAGENRIGLDAKLDIGIGLWTESVLAFRSKQSGLPSWNNATSIGTDYTLGIGNGLAVLFEHLVRADSFGWSHTTAGMASYPIGLLDNIRTIVLADWQSHQHQGHISWQRTLDNWLFALTGFWSSNTPELGVQLTVAFNH